RLRDLRDGRVHQEEPEHRPGGGERHGPGGPVDRQGLAAGDRRPHARRVQGRQSLALQGGPAQEHDRLLRGRADVDEGGGERLQGAPAIRALGDGRRQDGPDPDVRQLVRAEGRRQVQVARRAMTAAVSFEGITCTFAGRGGGAYTAVKDVSLSIADGEFVSVVGPTGCGKSTLLNVAAGLLKPSSGTL